MVRVASGGGAAAFQLLWFCCILAFVTQFSAGANEALNLTVAMFVAQMHWLHFIPEYSCF